MAAALRHAARMLQRTAAPEQCPRLSGRLVHGGPSPAVTSARRFTSSYTDGKVLFDTRIVDEKKKELYNLLKEVHGNSNCMLRRADRRLLWELSIVVKDPNDMELVLRHLASLISSLFKTGLVFYLGYKAAEWKLFDDRLEEARS